MADKIPNEIIDTGKNRKRELSISESEYEYNDQTDLETSTNKSSLYKSNDVCKRTSEQSLSDVIKKLTQQIEHIEKNFAKCQNVTNNTKVNDISCDDEFIYQPPNKIIKYDNDITIEDFCNSDENSIGSTNKIDTTKHVNKKIKLDDSERDSKNLTNEEVEMLLELSYENDVKIIYDDEDNTRIKTHNVQTNENSDSVSFPDKADTFNISVEHVFNESMMDNNKFSFSTEDQSMVQSNDSSESIMNHSYVFVNVSEILEMCDDNIDNSIDQNNFLDLTKCDNDEIILDHENCKSVTNEAINYTTSLNYVNSEILTDSDRKIQYSGDSIHETKSCESTINIVGQEQEYVCETLNRPEGNIFEPSNTVDDLHAVNILEAVHPKIIDVLDLTKCDNDGVILDHENCTSLTNESINCTTDFANIIVQERKSCDSTINIDDQENVCETLNNQEVNIFEPSNTVDDSHDVDVLEVGSPKIIDVLDLTQCDNDGIIFEPSNTVDNSHDVDVLEVGSPKILDVLDLTKCDNDGIIFEPLNTVDNLHDVDVLEVGSPKIIDVLDLTQCDNDGIIFEPSNTVDNSHDVDVLEVGSPKIIDVLNLTKCDNDGVILDHENCTSLTNESINCTTDFANIIVQERKSCDSTINIDDQENVCETLNNQEVNIFEPSNTVDDSHDVDVLEVGSPKIIDVLDLTQCDNDGIIFEPSNTVDNSHDVDVLEVGSPKILDVLDLTKCDNDGNILDHENCTIVTNEGINCTMPLNCVNSEILRDSDQKIQYSGDSIHETDFRKMIVQERKSCESTINVDDQENVCETLNNQEGNIFEPSNTVDDNVNILEAVHPKTIDCENSLNQKDLLDNNEYVNEEIMLENENVTCKLNLEQKNKGTLKILTIEEEEMLTKLVNNEDDKLGIVTDCTDKTTVAQTCEDYINENISKEIKNQEDLLVVTTHVSDENVSMVNDEGKSRSDQTHKPTMSMNDGVDITIFNNKEIDSLTERNFANDKVVVMPVEVTDRVNYNSLSLNYCRGMDDTTVDNFEVSISERNSQSSVTVDQFICNTFYFGTENCRDVSVHTIHSLDAYEVNNSLRNNTTVHSMENNDSLDFANIIVQERKSCDSTINIDDQGNVCETLNNQKVNIFEPSNTVDDSHDVDVLEVGSPKNIDVLDLTQCDNDGIIFEPSNTVDDSHDVDVLEVRSSKISDSVSFPDKADTFNISVEHVFNESMMDNNKFSFSTEDQSMVQSNDSSESIMNHSYVFVNVGEILEMCDDNIDNSIDQNNFLDLTKCDNDEIILDHENCKSVTNEAINYTTSLNYVNSEILTDSDRKIQYSGDSIHETKSCESTINIVGQEQEYVCETLNRPEGNIFEPSNTVDDLHAVNILEAVHPKIIDVLNLTKCDNDGVILDHENCTSLNNEGINCTTDFANIIVQERKSCDSTINIDDQENVCETLNNQEVNIFEPSNTVDDSHDVDVLEVGSPKIIDVLDLTQCDNDGIIFEPSNTVDNSHDVDVLEVGSPKILDVLDLTKCDNDGNILDHENCTIVTNEGINCTMPLNCVNSEILRDSDQKIQYSGDSIHETDFRKMIVQERKSCESTINVDDQENVCETLNNQEGNIFEPSNTVDDNVNILEAVHPKTIDCENSLNQKDLLDNNEYVNEEIMLENENVTCKLNLEQKNKGTLKILTIEEEEMLTKLVNNEDDKLGIVTDCTDKTTVAQTCEDYINENISKEIKNQEDLLVVTTHVSDENVSMVNDEGKRSVSFNSSDARQILESSNDDSEHFDDSLLFKPSDRDLVRYSIECEAYEKSISQSLHNLEKNVSNKEVIPQCNTPTSINKLVSSSYVKDYEDNVVDFYDCELSSIENSDDEDNLLLSFVKDTSMDDCIFEKNQNKLKNATNSTSNEETCDTNLKITNLGSPSESCNNLTNVVSLIHSPSHDHQCNEIISTSISKTEMQMNPDADDKLEGVNSNNTITSCNAISSFNDSDNINNIQSNNLCIDQGNFNENQNLEYSIKSLNKNNKNKSNSESNTHQNIQMSQKSYGGSESETESSMKIPGNCTIPKSTIEEIPKTNTVQSSSSVMDQSEIDKKKYLDEIVKNEQLFKKKFDEELDVNESAISPFISQSLAKSTNLKGALAKKAAAHINIHDMGDKALSTYLTQQTMTLDVLEVLHKSLDTCPSSDILMEDPEGLVVPLMPHQKHAIAWLIWRESQEPHGGILADDMGLGKTLSMISLILKSKEKKQDSLLPVVSIDSGRNDVINGGTLVVCPAPLINQWETEVKTKLKPGLLKVFQYYGMKRNCSALEMAKNDMVITSYSTVMWDQKKQQNTNPLCRIKWDRIILDEGHTIRNNKTQTSVAVCNIKSLNRWVITGTPIHNKEADFFTLLKFVRCKPFDDWAVWKRWVGNNDDAGKHRLSLLVKTLMLRRTKSELTQFTTFNLPKKEINTIEIELSKEERNAYEKLLRFSGNLFATYLYDRGAKEKVFDRSIKVQCKVQYFQEQNQDKDEVFKDHPELLKLFRQFMNIDEVQTYHILVLLLRLRQICCHPLLIKGPITEESIKKEDNMESIPEDDTGVFNNDSDIDIATFPNDIDLSELMSCLTLKDEPINKKPVIESNIFQKSWISTKIKTICDLVNKKILIKGNKEKAIIVSQWPSFLYLIRKHLAIYNAKMEMFSGSIPIHKRNKIISEFNQPNSGPQILLLSLKAGGVGLNLMAANHLFLVDIHWNPQLEAQACDRVYRVGQTKPVYVYKFICSNTIETRIMNIQTHKLQMADNLFKGNSITSKITIDDLKQIFQFH